MTTEATKVLLIQDLIDLAINTLRKDSIRRAEDNIDVPDGEILFNEERRNRLVEIADENIRDIKLLMLKPNLLSEALNDFLLKVTIRKLQSFFFSDFRPPCSQFPGIWPFCDPKK